MRDAGLLESALDRPRNAWHYADERDIGRLAALLLIGIARNHAFEQGNKRAALVAADAFLRINGYELAIPDAKLADPILAMIERTMGEPDFIQFIAKGVRRIRSIWPTNLFSTISGS